MTEMKEKVIKAVMMKSTILYLDADCCVSHPNKLFPLQPGSESLLQHDDESENFPVE